MGNAKERKFEATMGGNDRDFEATMGKSPKRSKFDIFWTDYENLDISYSCTEIMWGMFKSERLSISARKPDMDQETMEYAQTIVKEKLPGYYNYMFDE